MSHTFEKARQDRTIRRMALLLVAIALSLFSCSRRTPHKAPGAHPGLGPNLIRDGGFETTDPEAFPPHWKLEDATGAHAFVTGDHPLSDGRSLRIQLDADHIPPGAPVLLSCDLPILKMRDREVVLSLLSNGSAEAVAVLDTPTDGRIPPTIARLTDRFELASYVPRDARYARLTFRVYGTKGSWLDLDDVSVRLVK